MVDENGAPRGGATFIFYNPPIMDAELGLRRQPAARGAASGQPSLAAHGIQTVVFCRIAPGRRAAAHPTARGCAVATERPPDAVRGYRGGYLPTERRAIETGAAQRRGARAWWPPTRWNWAWISAGWTACVMVGYPGTIASTWQQAGRAGRGVAASVAFLVAASAPWTNTSSTHPDYFFGRSPEHALINPDNLYCCWSTSAARRYELPFAADERYGGQNPLPVLAVRPRAESYAILVAAGFGQAATRPPQKSHYAAPMPVLCALCWTKGAWNAS